MTRNFKQQLNMSVNYKGSGSKNDLLKPLRRCIIGQQSLMATLQVIRRLSAI